MGVSHNDDIRTWYDRNENKITIIKHTNIGCSEERYTCYIFDVETETLKKSEDIKIERTVKKIDLINNRSEEYYG